MKTEINGTQGPIPEGNIAIVVSRYNESITGQLLQGARETLLAAGIAEEDIQVIWVSGAWELPLPTSYAARRKETLAVITLGAVIKGETTHDEHINRSVCNALMDIGLATAKPILLGLLTCNTVDQAIQRAGGNMGNKGSECAEAALEMIRVVEEMQDQGTPKVGFHR
ncbi:6,7-dimethyl-8-ribityllumazine synthase [Rosistilla carotiformis]|uniref:6,7-dimethyl-8-ribityllumazine synthase n=1 Tax=Rosistilla carotiformis TaxID=2528017 RepID=A0A518JYW1_9BACT|nr:6,7-dimethyl-8-ribityllumazine synthase [Rosistilla carotiformis]QDV70724.1 6,7-dimethyl-8-ribityllumazine synthase [Rosistilla carotiformis]